jgi:hypothetical protein
MNEAGHVKGWSNRYNGGRTQLGLSAWLFDGTSTLDIGLTGPEHTRSDGYKESLAGALNEAGQVVGGSKRYNGGSVELGHTAWLFDGSRTIELGLTGADHTRDDGYRASFAGGVNEAGQVGGISRRYSGSTAMGMDAWLYDAALDQTFVLQLSRRSDGYAFTTLRFLGNDGQVMGTYSLFDASDNYLGERAYYFTISDGLHDLGSLVDGGLSTNGWDALVDSFGTNDAGQIVGNGTFPSYPGPIPFLLTPVPEPSSGMLALATFLSLIVVCRRRARELYGRAQRNG